jgi:uncharacterized membrane protein YkvA (DUF1232 family)
VGAFASLWKAMRGRRRAGAPGLGHQLQALPRLVSATLGGRYGGLDRSRLLLMALAALYVVSPVDLLPEGFLLLFGVADDAVVLAWLAGTVLEETDRFLAWEAGQPASDQPASGEHRRGERVVPGETV